MPTITLKVSSGNADGFVQGGLIYKDTPAIDVGMLFGNVSDAWLYFVSVQVPQGTTITSAKLRLQGSLSYRVTNLKILAEASDNVPTPPSSVTDYYSRPRTSAVAWDDVPAWSGWVESPDIASVIQEIISRPGWVLGNAMCIFLQDNGSVPQTEDRAIRRLTAYEGNPEGATELIITYEEAVGWYLTISSSPVEGGLTSPEGEVYVPAGEPIQVMAYPNAGYKFSNWLLDGASYGSANPITIPAQVGGTRHTLVAVFTLITVTHTLEVRSSPISGVPVTVDGSSVGSTPTPPIIVKEATHTVEVPQEIIA